jgi:calmodulin
MIEDHWKWFDDFSRRLAQHESLELIVVDPAGSVDIDEFLELMRTKTKEAQDEVEVKEAFRILDKDGKGEIHTDVIKEILMKLDDNLTDADLNEMIAEIDEDGSGWVDYDEFKGLMLG